MSTEEGFTVVTRKKRNSHARTQQPRFDSLHHDIERRREYVLDQEQTFLTHNITRKSNPKKSESLLSLEEVTQFFDEYFLGSINELKSTQFYSSTKEKLCCLVKDWNTCNKSQGAPESSCIDIVCYGVGNFLSNKVSTQQLALISALADDLKFEGKRWMYDPLLTDMETKLSHTIQWDTIPQNEEGKRTLRKIPQENGASQPARTLFFMPHCGAKLYDNVLSANWDPNLLSHLMIIGNTFSDVADRHNKTKFYLSSILPCVSEHSLENDLMDKSSRNIFNHTSIHTFQSEKIQELPASTWATDSNINNETANDPEFIPSSVTSAINNKQNH